MAAAKYYIISSAHNRWTEAAFKGSVKVGNDEIVNYFLHNFPDETSDLKVYSVD